MISVIILAFNEEIHIARAIGSVRSVAEAIYVVDSFSTDRTVEICRSLGVNVVQNKFVNHSLQFQWALDHLPIGTEWVMKLDADEIISADLESEMIEKLPCLEEHISGVYLRLRYVFLGREMKYGGRDLRLLRLFRREAAKMAPRWMDEKIRLKWGTSTDFSSRMYDSNLKGISSFTAKHNQYASREALQVLMQELSLVPSDADVSKAPQHGKFWLKAHLYDALPVWLAPYAYFAVRYFILLGFLDGREGLIYHTLQGLWYRLLVGAKVLEMRNAMAHLSNESERIAELERISGLPVREAMRHIRPDLL